MVDGKPASALPRYEGKCPQEASTDALGVEALKGESEDEYVAR